MGCRSYKDFAPMALIWFDERTPSSRPSPQGEGEFSVSLKFARLVCRTRIRKTRDGQRLFLLPGGKVRMSASVPTISSRPQNQIWHYLARPVIPFPRVTLVSGFAR